MFAEMLREARGAAAMPMAELAARSGTSRAAIADYEAGRKIPRTDTAERVLNALGLTLTSVRVPGVQVRHAVFDRADADRLARLRMPLGEARRQARTLTAEIIESACAVEDILLGWGEIRALAEGISIGGDPLKIWRATEIARLIRASIKRGASTHPWPLRSVGGDTLIEADPDEDAGMSQLEYLVSAIAAGADATAALQEVSRSLVQDGLPWLYVPYADVATYRQALVAAKRTGDGGDLVRILVDGAQGRKG